MIKVCGLALYGTAAASTRYRLSQYVDKLTEQGIQLDVVPLLGENYIHKTFSGMKYGIRDVALDYMRRLFFIGHQRDYDAVIIQAELFPFLPGAIESRLIHVPYICDFDDATFLKYRLERFKAVSFLLKDKFNPVIDRAAAVLAGNEYLRAFAQKRNPDTVLLPTVVDTDRYVVAPQSRANGFTVGWIGSPSTSVYLRELSQPLSKLGREGPIRFVVVGGRCDPIDNVEVVNLPWSEATEVDLINTFDVGVMPLFDDEWAKGKCALKLIQYMACGLPVVASPVGTNVDLVESNCGFLAADAKAWVERLRLLRDSPDLRRRMGADARQRVEQAYSLHSALPTLAATIQRVVARSRANKGQP
jgi:glycosyltransferase involved in cell wall biosynthesis